jgi:hypothetical protein
MRGELVALRNRVWANSTALDALRDGVERRTGLKRKIYEIVTHKDIAPGGCKKGFFESINYLAVRNRHRCLLSWGFAASRTDF